MGAQDIIITIDVFTKWVEIRLLPHLSLTRAQVWFHANMVCRYGFPAAVCCYRESEYSGEFDMYFQRAGILR